MRIASIKDAVSRTVLSAQDAVDRINVELTSPVLTTLQWRRRASAARWARMEMETMRDRMVALLRELDKSP